MVISKEREWEGALGRQEGRSRACPDVMAPVDFTWLVFCLLCQITACSVFFRALCFSYSMLSWKDCIPSWPFPPPSGPRYPIRGLSSQDTGLPYDMMYEYRKRKGVYFILVFLIVQIMWTWICQRQLPQECGRNCLQNKVTTQRKAESVGGETNTHH